ncbi:MAG: hypothetical protein HRT86_12640 [Ilumatobacteraceae bacterium]|nr:hypothetical protein [Ilumatobacteraceae bacterium]
MAVVIGVHDVHERRRRTSDATVHVDNVVGEGLALLEFGLRCCCGTAGLHETAEVAHRITAVLALRVAISWPTIHG